MRPLDLALIGSRGIPARYGGYETLMEELAGRLVERGHRVTVYCRSHYTPVDLRSFRGAELVVLPTLRAKVLDTPIHTLLSCLHAARRGFDAALVVNSANALFVPLLQVAAIPVALHVDGIEKRRAKWGPFGRAVYALSERLACVLPDRLITDAEVIRRHYLDRHLTDSKVLVYGVEATPPEEEGALTALGLEDRGYFLYVSRFEPENNPHRVVEAYGLTRDRAGSRPGDRSRDKALKDIPLVMVGGAPYADDFIRRMVATAGPRVLFPGPIYGAGYRELLSHALAYVQATEVGGTHPALVEAMGYGNCLLVNDTPENREVAGDSALYFRAAEPATLAALFDRVRGDRDAARAQGRQAAERAAERFSWQRVAEGYETLLARLAGQEGDKA